MERFPNKDEIHWPTDKSCKGLKSNITTFCPILRCFVGIVTTCYNCQLGFNGSCESLNSNIAKEPEIINEIYKPTPELTALKLSSKTMVYKKELYTLKKLRLVKNLDKEQVFSIIGKFKFCMRFIPKYEEVKISHLGVKFYLEKQKEIIDFSELVYYSETKDIVYSLRKDKKLIDTLELMEKLNGES